MLKINGVFILYMIILTLFVTVSKVSVILFVLYSLKFVENFIIGFYKNLTFIDQVFGSILA